MPGGGTVLYVNPEGHRYIRDPVHREEGGTPAIIESIRAGLVFQLQQAVGTELIRERESSFLSRAVRSWESNPNIGTLGNLAARRLSIVSFAIRSPSGRYLHHNLVVSMLNDVFGIQSRGGCSCAGPYGHRLLGMDLERSHEFETEISRGCEGIKPGWVRINFNNDTADESALAEHLAEAQLLFAQADAPDSDEPLSRQLTAEFEHLRWFELSDRSLAPMAAGAESSARCSGEYRPARSGEYRSGTVGTFKWLTCHSRHHYGG